MNPFTMYCTGDQEELSPFFPCGARTVEVFAYPIGKDVHGTADGIIVLRGAGSRVGVMKLRALIIGDLHIGIHVNT